MLPIYVVVVYNGYIFSQVNQNQISTTYKYIQNEHINLVCSQ
jgi:hypothetical protein